jgi:hypothetical protein
MAAWSRSCWREAVAGGASTCQHNLLNPPGAGCALPWEFRTRDVPIMVERKIELKRRYQRKKKLAKLKRKLATAKTNHDKEVVLKKIQVISPWWKEPAAQA